ncbi:AbfB domain-containing protein [Streptomyces ureilyticus]|uniref:Alpha-L-arabinofuranosidase n=1 Tax=Streptomyces ureilyticus TaxID=1775131 RepID=A0ABX0DNE8_9ACTN|nr:AbfB domain-containing protein [Streptomyces ureilyticus]NGO43391.1 alpha-L-arabinofuranosidase [Streptomyces ureilyticus]
MPDSKPGPGPDQPAPEPKGAQGRPPRAAAHTADPQLPAPAEAPPKVWETGEDLDGGRIPGTRRLYLAGVLAAAVLASTVTAIAILDQTEDKESQEPQTTSAAQPVVPDLTPEGPTTEPSGKSGLASPQPSPEDAASDSKDDSSEERQRGSEPIKAPPKPPASSKAPKPPASTSLKSVQAVNYPDRYWHFSDGTGRLDQVSSGSSAETRQNSSFTLVPGLADSGCVSFSTGDGGYVRHRNFQLRTDRHDGSELFKKDATFCPRPSSYSGAVMLEAVNFPGSFVRHRNFQLRLERYEHSGLYRADSAFRLVKGLS